MSALIEMAISEYPVNIYVNHMLLPPHIGGSIYVTGNLKKLEGEFLSLKIFSCSILSLT